ARRLYNSLFSGWLIRSRSRSIAPSCSLRLIDLPWALFGQHSCWRGQFLHSPGAVRYCSSTTSSTLERFCLLCPTYPRVLPSVQTYTPCSASYLNSLLGICLAFCLFASSLLCPAHGPSTVTPAFSASA